MAWREQADFGQVRLKQVTLASLGAASEENKGVIAYTSNGYGGSAGLVISNGTNWLRVTDNTTVAASS